MSHADPLADLYAKGGASWQAAPAFVPWRQENGGCIPTQSTDKCPTRAGQEMPVNGPLHDVTVPRRGVIPGTNSKGVIS